MEAHDVESAVGGVVAQPAQREFIPCREDDQGVGGQMPVADETGMGDREVERRVRDLADARGRWKIGPGDQVEARDRALAVWHGATVPMPAHRHQWYSGHPAP
ncbi:hypothetical protein [Actinomadura sp. HBU206391]|uniref:hypothetical protein n=1 Tax=Actinomadura sp. HBU206391 TaxID=2731692 RepID=UPI00164F177F|nr:hypothetical protein [Actinomadura sp. HBU206391]MBC6459906.1 hypothetical protein [Actinomadura sp. HBU206391]